MMAKWWQGSTHSTDKAEPPESYEASPKTPQLLFDWSEYHFNFSKERVKMILSSHDITTFHVSSWWTYTELIRQAWEDDEAMKEFPEVCPICGAPIERDRGKDGLFGVKYGWLCTANRFHFIQERVNVLRSKQFANSIRDPNRPVITGRPEDNPNISTPESIGVVTAIS